MALQLKFLIALLHIASIDSEPLSRPYISHFTSPWDQTIPITSPNKAKRNPDSSSYIESDIQWNTVQSKEQYRTVNVVDIQKALSGENWQCPIDFSMGFSTTTTPSNRPSSSLHNHTFTDKQQSVFNKVVGIHSSPVLYPIHPADTAGKSILFLRDYDYLDMITPTRYTKTYSRNTETHHTQDVLTRDDQFPLLFEQSMFGYGIHPLIHDVDSDGVPDAILVDYDGAITIVGLDVLPQHTLETKRFGDLHSSRFTDEMENVPLNRFFHQRQIPRLIVRKDWVQLTLNQTLMEQMAKYGLDPYHSFFEYNSDAETTTTTISQTSLDGSIILPVDTISQDKFHVFRGVSGDLLDLSVDMVRIQRQQQERMAQQQEQNIKKRRLQEVKVNPENTDILEEDPQPQHPIVNEREGLNYYGDDMTAGYHVQEHGGDDYYPVIKSRKSQETEESKMRTHFYKDEHYIHLPPHVLTTATYTEIPSRYKNENPFSVEELLLIPVSYFLDEEEFSGHQRFKRFQNSAGGDETEFLRGQYVASALIVYDLINQRFLSNIHLDLSTDETAPSPVMDYNINSTEKPWAGKRIGAFALASPTVADLDGDGVMEALIGTSMGMVYSLSLPYGYRNLGFPIQMKYPVEQPIIIEDVLGDRDLEVFIIDSGGNVVCLNHKGGTQWHRALIHNEEEALGAKITKTSTMMMGDVDGDGSIDIVVTVLICRGAYPFRSLRLYAINARDGKDLKSFPQEIIMEGSESYLDNYIATIPNPLLVDLHARSKGFSWKHVLSQPSKASIPRKGSVPHGGSSPGLHIVQPLQSILYIFEGGSGCCQAINNNFEVHSMAQVDDMHGSGSLDLVLTSVSGAIYTLDIPDVVPYHPLNVHSRPDSYIHGYSTSSGIFVHNLDRKHRDVLGVVFFLTLEVFDKRMLEIQGSDKYNVEIRDGPSARRKIFQKIYDRPGVYTEKIYIPYGPGYYTLSIRMKTNHGLVYEDVIHLGYNVNYSVGLTTILIFPIIAAIISLVSLSQVKRKDPEHMPILHH